MVSWETANPIMNTCVFHAWQRGEDEDGPYAISPDHGPKHGHGIREDSQIHFLPSLKKASRWHSTTILRRRIRKGGRCWNNSVQNALPRLQRELRAMPIAVLLPQAGTFQH
jgi:hypothetical protein